MDRVWEDRKPDNIPSLPEMDCQCGSSDMFISLESWYFDSITLIQINKWKYTCDPDISTLMFSISSYAHQAEVRRAKKVGHPHSHDQLINNNYYGLCSCAIS